MAFYLFILLFILQRLSELWYARRNERWLRANGALEFGSAHYPATIALHTCFILALVLEYFFRGMPSVDMSFLCVWFALILAKIWVIRSLGSSWNTKIFRIPGLDPVRKGPYRILRHPNYAVVVCEFIVVPLIFHLFTTMIVFSVLNGIMLNIRIRVEDAAWGED